MKKLNLSALNAAELNQLKSEIEKELSDRHSRMEAIDELRKLAESKGLKFREGNIYFIVKRFMALPPFLKTSVMFHTS